MRSWLQRGVSALIKTVTGLCIGYFVLWACAPPTAMPPPVPHAAGAMEVGAAAAFSVPGEGDCLYGRCPQPIAVDLVAWYQYAPTERFSVTPLVFMGQVSGVGGGGLFRYRFNRASRFSIGGELGAGFAWLSLGLPVSAAITDGFWLYTKPTFTYNYRGFGHLPLGASLRLSDAWWLNAEAGAFLGSKLISTTGVAPYGSFGFSYRF